MTELYEQFSPAILMIIVHRNPAHKLVLPLFYTRDEFKWPYFFCLSLKIVQSSITYLSGSITLYICTCSTHLNHHHRHATRIVGSTIPTLLIYWQHTHTQFNRLAG